MGAVDPLSQFIGKLMHNFTCPPLYFSAPIALCSIIYNIMLHVVNYLAWYNNRNFHRLLYIYIPWISSEAI